MITRIATPTARVYQEKPPNTICSGFIDIDGTWNNGFECPIENSIQYFCCGTDNYRYCCPFDRYSSETNPYRGSDPIMYDAHRHNSILTDEITTSLINNQQMINKQFQQFQKYFLPTFLLTTTILLLIGIALWFWLYKHKTYYSLTADDHIESRVLHRIQAPSDPMTRQNERCHVSVERNAHIFKNPSSEV